VDLFLLRCGSCHPVKPPPKNGPPLLGIANRYRAEYPDFHSFKDALTGFIENPTEEKALMPEAISEFYLMFKMSVDQRELAQITAMMWNLDNASLWLQKSFLSDTIAGIELGKGGKLFAEKCGACHSFEPPPRNGPPARGMTRNYIFEFNDFMSFKEAFLSFIQNPSEDKAVMPQAVNRFGLMPEMDFKKQELEEITQWLWNTYGKAPCAGKGAQRGFRRKRQGGG
jgi:cytochrome c2